MSNDTSVAAAAVKVCCACGVDVAGKPRMKDSQNRYWCVPCGEADQRFKAMSSTTANCAGCHKPFSKGKLDKHGEHFFCKPCMKKRTKADTTRVMPAASAVPMPAAAAVAAPAIAARSVSSGSTGDHKRAVVLAALLGGLILISVLFNFVWAG